MSHPTIPRTIDQMNYPPKRTSDMSTTHRPYFIIVGLPDDDKTMQDLDVEQLFHMKSEEVHIQLGAMQKSLKDNGFDFDCKCSRNVVF